MADHLTERETRTRAVIAVLAAKGPLTAGRIAAELGIRRYAIIRYLNCSLFEVVVKGKHTWYRLSEAGKRLAEEMDLMQ